MPRHNRILGQIHPLVPLLRERIINTNQILTLMRQHRKEYDVVNYQQIVDGLVAEKQRTVEHLARLLEKH